MSTYDLQLLRKEKISELGFLYYNKAVDGMEMHPEALEVITDIRSRFGYLLFLKQSAGNDEQIKELDAQIAVQFCNLGEICYGYFTSGIEIDADLSTSCRVIASLDGHLNHEDELADNIKQSATSLADNTGAKSENVQTVKAEQNTSAQEKVSENEVVSATDFVMPAPRVASENESDDEKIRISSIRIENVEKKLLKKCVCGVENRGEARFCKECGQPL